MYILDDELKRVKVQSRHSVKTHVKQDQGPLKKGVNSVG